MPDPAPVAAPAPAGSGGLTLVDVRRLWPDIIEATKQRRRITWIHLSQNAQVVAVDERTLTLGFANGGARDSFESGGSAEIVRQAVIDVIGADWKIETIVDPGADASSAPPPAAPVVAARPEPAPPAAAPAPAAPAAPAPETMAPSAAPASASAPPPDEPPSWATDEPDHEPGYEPTSRPAPVPVPAPVPASPDASAVAREALRQARPEAESPGPAFDPDADASPDDLDADSELLGTDDLLARELGAQVIEEIPHA